MTDRAKLNEPSPLELDPETMRRMAHEVVELLVERIATLDEQPAWRREERARLEALLRQDTPRSGEPFAAVLAQLRTDVLEYAGRIDHPRFMAFIPACPTWPGILADFVAGAFNVFQGTWLASSGPSEVELIVLDWFKEWLGYPAAAAGLLVSGGSAANLTALVAARELRLDGVDPQAVLYASDQAHSSIERAAMVAGFRPRQVRLIPSDERFRIRLDALAAAVEDDVASGRKPFLAVGNAGATNTGAIDPLPEMADLCERHGIWLHVDAAYGGFAALTERGRRWLDGIGRADSVTLDPHKWLFQPYEAGCVLLRDGHLLGDVFHVMPDYLQDTAVKGPGPQRAEAQDYEGVVHGNAGGVNFADRGIQLTRMARALKIWVSLKYFGVDAFRDAVDRALDLALEAERWIAASPRLELMAPATLGIVAFRRRVPGADEAEVERVNAEILGRILESGLAMFSSTRLGGRYALRLCIMNFRTRWADVERVLEAVAEG